MLLKLILEKLLRSKSLLLGNGGMCSLGALHLGLLQCFGLVVILRKLVPELLLLRELGCYPLTYLHPKDSAGVLRERQTLARP